MGTSLSVSHAYTKQLKSTALNKNITSRPKIQKKPTPILQLYTKYSDPENLNTDVKIIYLQGCHVPFWDRVQGSSKLGKLSHFGKLGKIAHLLNEEQN